MSRARGQGKRIAIGAAALVVLLLGWMWLRDSPLVGVDDVTVIGAGGPQSAAITEALTSAGKDQTTLHVDDAALRRAVASIPLVASVHADAGFPHKLRITVVQHEPVANVVDGSSRLAVASDGTLLRGASIADVPTLPSGSALSGRKVTDRKLKSEVALLAAAPAPLRAKIAKAYLGPRGLTVRMRAGGSLDFGSAARLRAKWASATAVLGDPKAKGATRIDVRIPELPTAGGLEQIATQEAPQP